MARCLCYSVSHPVVPLLRVKKRKATVIPWRLNWPQSDLLSKLLQACDSRKKVWNLSVRPWNASCHIEYFGLWGWRGVSGLSAAGGGSAVVCRSGVWLCKRRGRLRGGRGLLAAPLLLSHTASGNLDIKRLVTVSETGLKKTPTF